MMNKNMQTRVRKAMICAAIREDLWGKPDEVPPLSIVQHIPEDRILSYGGEKTLDWIRFLLGEAGLKFVSPVPKTEEERRERHAYQIAEAIRLLRLRGYVVGLKLHDENNA